MSELTAPASRQEVVDLITFVLIETVAAVSPTSDIADERLEDIASKLLSLSDRITGAPGSALLIRATAQQLIQTEAGTGD